MSQPATPLRDALLLVFGTHATRDEYPTKHVLAVVNKLLGGLLTEAELIDELRQLSWAHPRPGKPGSKHLLKWRFSNANGAGVTTPRTTRRLPRREKSLAESQRLKK